MSRRDTVVGLNRRAEDIVKGCGFPHWERGSDKRIVAAGEGCGITIELSMPKLLPCVKVEESENTYLGMSGQTYPLKKYHFRNGAVLEEFIQKTTWSSGPQFFLALWNFFLDKPAENSLWTLEELE